jgi:hypothetical protein
MMIIVYYSLHAQGVGNVGRLVLRDFFNNPSILPEPGILDFVTAGLLTQPIQRFDNHVTTEVSYEFVATC